MKRVLKGKLLFIIFVFISLLFSFILNLYFISAQEPTVGEVFFGDISDFFGKIFGGVDNEGNPIGIFNYTRVLLGILLWMVFYSVVVQIGLFKDLEPKIFWTGGLAVILTLLSFIYLPNDFVAALSIPYSATGATILTFIPFFIIIYFTVWVTDSLTLARLIWIVFLIYYVVIFIYVVFFSEFAATGQIPYKSVWPYIVVFFIGIFIFAYLGKIRLWVFEGKISEIEEKGKKRVKKAAVGARILGAAADEFSEGGGI